MAEQEQWSRLPQLFSYIEKLKDEGMTDEQIAEHLREVDQYEFDCMIEQMKADGLSQEEIDAFVTALKEGSGRQYDDDPLDAIDSSDEGYVDPDAEG